MVKQTDEPVVFDDVEAGVRAALERVHDPEIPPLSIVDLGIVERVRVTGEEIQVELLPTFAGCPALDVIREDVTVELGQVAGARRIDVRFVASPPWTSDRITPAGREALRSQGLTPPSGTAPAASAAGGPIPIRLGGPPERARCPFCGSDDTVRESAFGPTLCRSTHFCNACRNPFEAFKPKLYRRDAAS
jgi:ring-1,2-phenylacetyl-CoA epoxidase subunit PaaD